MVIVTVIILQAQLFPFAPRKLKIWRGRSDLSTDISLPLSNTGNAHIAEIATMALDLLAGSVIFQIPHRPGKESLLL